MSRKDAGERPRYWFDDHFDRLERQIRIVWVIFWCGTLCIFALVTYGWLVTQP
jgi:hypothetical protein